VDFRPVYRDDLDDSLPRDTRSLLPGSRQVQGVVATDGVVYAASVALMFYR